MTGRVPSAFSSARLIERSSTVLFHVGQLLRGERPTAIRRSALGSPHMAGSFSIAIGSLWPHQMATDGWWPRRSTAAAAWRTACLRMPRA